MDHLERVKNDKARWIFEFVEQHGNLEKLVSFASDIKKTIYPLIMDGKISVSVGPASDENYIVESRKLWANFFEGDKYNVPGEVVDWLSKDMGAPWTVFGQLMYIATEQGYEGGNNDLDGLIDDLSIKGILH